MIQTILAVALQVGGWASGHVAASVDTCNGCTQAQARTIANRWRSKDVENVVVLDYWRSMVWECKAPGAKAPGDCMPAAEDVQLAFDTVGDHVRALATGVEIPYESGDIHDIAGCPACARRWQVGNRELLATQAETLDALLEAGASFAEEAGISGAGVLASLQEQVVLKFVLANDGSPGPGKAYCLGHLLGTSVVIDADRCVDGTRKAVRQPG